MTACRVGDIVSIEYPYFDLQTHKHRPGLVLVSRDVDLVIARVTIHPPRDQSDVALNRWAEVGLPRASTVRLTKLATIDHHLIYHMIGRLHSEDSRAVVQAWQQLAATVVTLLSE